MKQLSSSVLLLILGLLLPAKMRAQCSLTNATACVCKVPGQSSCDLLPDITISWYGLESYSSGPSEYPQTGANAGRLRVSGSTPNIGHGPLEVRTADVNGLRRFVCGPDTFSVSGQQNFSCPNGQVPKQVLHQRIYQKQGNQMLSEEVMTGNMTYHSSHNHYHVDDWTTMTLRVPDPAETDPRNWPVVATGAKVGFCLMDYGSCTTYSGHCRSSQEYGGGTNMTNGAFPNYGLYGSYGCGTNVQGISVGRTDIYSKSLDMMWINMMDGLCNGNYWIVAEVDPTNVFREENDDNNWTAIPYTLSQQRPAGSGGTATILAEEGTRCAEGGTVRLTATPGYAYQWSNGATTRSIEVTSPGNYSVTVTAPCGSLASGSVNVNVIPAPEPPEGQGASVFEGEQATLGATGQGLHWYDAPSGGELVAVGATVMTPPLNADLSYWVESRSISEGVHAFGAKTDRSAGAQNSSNLKQALIFDASEPFELVSVKVYATGNGDRHFVLVDNVGNLIEERYVYVRDGEQRVDLGFMVPAGTNHRITAFNDNTEVMRNLHRDASGVTYPYAISSVGTITGSTGGGSNYYYLYDWEVRTPDVTGVSSRTEVTATVDQGVRISAKVFLEGPYDPGTGLMRDDLRTNGYLPTTEPYSALGFAQVGSGGESIIPASLGVTGSEAIVDWVLVELRENVPPSNVLATCNGLLLRNGQIVSTAGEALRFSVPEGQYHVAVRHRNHFGCMTAQPVVLSNSVVVVDLTLPSMSTWGTDARKSTGSAMVLWSGNVLPDDRLKYTGSANDRDLILSAIGGVIPTQTLSGYHAEDTNLDGVVKYTGAGNDRDPILTNIGGITPTQVRLQQLP
jgi:hypothetical protein